MGAFAVSTSSRRVDHLAYLMRHVYEHRDEARAVGRRASEVVPRDWTWSSAAARLVSFLNLEPSGPSVAAAAEPPPSEPDIENTYEI